jgi:hypothetical protein
MRLNAPKVIYWWCAVILGVIGLIGYFLTGIAILNNLAFWLVLIGLAVLAVTTVLKGV